MAFLEMRGDSRSAFVSRVGCKTCSSDISSEVSRVIETFYLSIGLKKLSIIYNQHKVLRADVKHSDVTRFVL